MALSNRETLKLQFQPGRHLSAGDFEALIDSMLNKYTDQFHGVWKPGRTYCHGDVVLYYQEENHDGQKSIESCNFWVMKRERCVCASQVPPKDSECWKPFPDDGDWVALADKGVMWAKVFDRVGIGIGDEDGDRTDERNHPQARLDVRKISRPANEETPPAQPHDKDSKDSCATATGSPAPPSSTGKGEGRWLLFPQGATQTQATLLHYDGEIKKNARISQEFRSGTAPQPPLYQSERLSYFTTGLSLKEVTLCGNAANGFAFRQGKQELQETNAFNLDPTTGKVMMVVQPRLIKKEGLLNLACLGLNVDQPSAVLDITDVQRGHMHFLPDDATDPTLRLLRPKNEEQQIFASLRVGLQETVLESSTEQGFEFYQRAGTAEEILSSDLLMKLRLSSSLHRPQIGIGTANPIARLDIHSQKEQVQVQLLPEQEGSAVPAIALLQHRADQSPLVLTTALGDRVSGWISNAEHGFVFQTPLTPLESGVETAPRDATLLQSLLPPGQTHLAIQPSGYIGIGTETPLTRLEITSCNGFGTFLFSPDQSPHSTPQTYPAMVIRNREPEQNLTLGTGATHAILFTDTPGGFQFKASPPAAEEPSNPFDVNAGRVLINISPEGNGRVGIGCLPRDYEIDVQGIVQTMAVYQDTNADQIRNVKPLNFALSRLQRLRPITFEWNRDAEISTPDAARSPTSEPSESEPESTKNPKDSDQGSHQQIGLLAHEVERFFPEVVRTANDGTQSVAYANLVPVLIQSIQELDRQHQLELRRLQDFTGLLANRIALLVLLLSGSWAIVLLNYLFF